MRLCFRIKVRSSDALLVSDRINTKTKTHERGRMRAGYDIMSTYNIVVSRSKFSPSNETLFRFSVAFNTCIYCCVSELSVVFHQGL